MRVLFLTHRLPFAPNRGDRIRAYHMLQFLSRHATVDLLSLVHDDEEEARVSSALKARRVTIVRTTPWRNRLRAGVLLGSGRPLTHVLLDSPGMLRAVEEAAAASRPDVVLAYCSGMARLALTPALRRVPLVLDMVDVDSAKWGALARTSAPPMRWVYGREARCLAHFERGAVRHARTSLVVNERERETLAAMVPAADVQVVGNGIDLETFRPAEVPTREPAVVFCGVMNYAPNEDAAVRLARDVWPVVRRAIPAARLILLGAHPTVRVQQLASERDGVEVTGSVPDVRPHLWRAAVSVAPLQTARGLQNKVLEALAAGLPTVVTPAVAEGLPAAVLPGCVVASQPSAIADAVVRLLTRSSLERHAMAKQADLESLTWERQLAPLVPVLRTAAARRPCIRLAS